MGNATTRCCIPGCNRTVRCRNLCNGHYIRMIRTGEAGSAEIIERGPWKPCCSIEGCEKPHRARGYCNAHYERWRLFGDALAVVLRAASEFRKEDVGYHAVHRRLRTTRGLASTHSCQSCGGTAEDWAYTNDDPTERVDPDGRFSLDLDRYIPLCKPCHGVMDSQFRAGHQVLALAMSREEG